MLLLLHHSIAGPVAQAGGRKFVDVGVEGSMRIQHVPVSPVSQITIELV